MRALLFVSGEAKQHPRNQQVHEYCYKASKQHTSNQQDNEYD